MSYKTVTAIHASIRPLRAAAGLRVPTILAFLGLIAIGRAHAATVIRPRTSSAVVPVAIHIQARKKGYAIPHNFCGLSFETMSETPTPADRAGIRGSSRPLFSPIDKQLITLFRNMGVRNLRLGGGTLDGLHAAHPSDADIDRVFGFAKAAGVKVIYSLQLLNGNPRRDAATARYIWTSYRRNLECFALGNEPDVPSYHYPPHGAGTGTDPAIRGYRSYLADWRKFALTILRAVPTAKFAGPDAAGKLWAAWFARDQKHWGHVILITQHWYVGGGPFIPGTRIGMSSAMAIKRMLGRSWPVKRYPRFFHHNVAPVLATGFPCRMTEMNDYLYGVNGASNAFASALWALDLMHWWAAHGCCGINFHNTRWIPTDTIYVGRSGGYKMRPKGYAFRAFDLGSHGRVEPAMLTNVDHLNLTAYAVGTAKTQYVTIINKEYGRHARPAEATLAFHDFTAHSARVMFLRAPHGDVGAQHGVTLGGAAITNHAPWHGRWRAMNSRSHGNFTLYVPPASAAIVRVSGQ